ncbi:MAG: esterase [Cyanobacteria bacterium PR.3.49]|nr:esterase [Cyanobacteria bacterium PR.3.49]
MLREYHKWHSPILNREMELLQFGHAGARVIIFPTSCGRFFDWENRGMINALSRHIDEGWLQVFCVDGVDNESWFNTHANPTDRARRHLQFQEYIIQEALPFTKSKNDNDFVIACGASFGAYHSYSIAMRYPTHFNRVLGMSGVYDVREWTNNEMNDVIAQGSPCEYMLSLHDSNQLDQIRKLDLIIPVGRMDPLFGNNRWFSQILWEKGIWHAFREWDGFGHDWPWWYDMIQHYIGGPESRP